MVSALAGMLTIALVEGRVHRCPLLSVKTVLPYTRLFIYECIDWLIFLFQCSFRYVTAACSLCPPARSQHYDTGQVSVTVFQKNKSNT